MKGQIAVVLIVAALFAGAAIGYLGNTSSQTTVTKTYTLTQGSGLEACTVTQYALWSIESVHNGTSIGGGTSTASNVVTTFQTTGLPSSTTNTYAGTLTGAISSWTVTNCNAGLQTSAVTPLSRSNGDWVFSIRLQSSLLAMGQQFALSYNLTNISGQPQTVHEVNPLINPTIYSANGTLVWAWNPPTENFITTIPSEAGNWTGPFDIPTSALSAGQKYVLSVYPLIGATTTSAMAVGDYSIGESLMINATIGVT